jgi:general secretion pathway protein C
MATLSAGHWTVRGATFALWALAAASAAYWGMKFSARSSAATAQSVPARSAAPVDPQAVARLLGAHPMAATAAAPVATLASRFALIGVAAQGSGHGAALVSVDGKPAKPYRVGAQLDEGIVLQSVKGRKAVLASAASGQPVLTLELPAPSMAAAAQRPPPIPIPAPR